MSKRYGRNSETRADLIAEYEEKILKNVNDKGARGKLFELLCRDFLNNQLAETDIRCRRMGIADATKKINGKMTRFEMKSGCGVLCEDYNASESIESQILAGADIVVYVDYFNMAIAPEKQAKVFTRQGFIDGLASYKKGLDTWLKIADKGEVTKINLQEFKTSGVKAKHLILEMMGNAPSLENWLAQQG